MQQTNWKDCLPAVAIAYGRAVQSGQHPTVAVAEKLQVSRATAGRAVAAARSAGLLDPPNGPHGWKPRHYPRTARWTSGEAWKACAICRTPWPCESADVAARQPLVRPDGKDPDTFYRRVADAYLEATADTRSAGLRIAGEAGVPVTTAHRWIREARRRGFIPATTKGRVSRP